jgi:hypothetical protein
VLFFEEERYEKRTILPAATNSPFFELTLIISELACPDPLPSSVFDVYNDFLFAWF